MIARYELDSYPDAVSRTLGENIRTARGAAGIKTQGAFAKKLGVPQPQVSDWENDRYAKIELKNLLKIAATIPCSLETLVEGLDAQYDAARDLVDHEGQVQRSLVKGGSDVTVAARIRELEDRVAAYQTILAKIRRLGGEFLELTSSGAESSEAPRAQARRGGRH